MKTTFARILAILALLMLAACASAPQQPAVVPGYEGVQDGEFFIEPVPETYLTNGNRREEVAYAGDEKPGTIVVDTHVRKLYLVLEGGRAMRYPIAVGREGIAAALARGEAVDPASYYMRTTPIFETGDARYSWLNDIVAVGSGIRQPDAVVLDFYQLT